jgi:hypothetical protein
MILIVIKRYTHGPELVYARAAERGRMLPPGLAYLESWVASRERLAPPNEVHGHRHTGSKERSDAQAVG